MVGNDIIDLDETRRTTNWERPGFQQKVFAPKEQKWITESNDAFKAVWQLWSMKESAYKVFMQTGRERFYNPTKLECTFDSPQRGRVRFGDMSVQTSTSFTSAYIFTLAFFAEGEIESQVFQLSAGDSAFQSTFMKKEVLGAFAESVNCKITELELRKNSEGVPAIYHGNKRVRDSLSITHHGYYGAYSILKE